MGYQVMRAKNFRVIGDQLLHDAHLILHAQNSPVFERDPLDYLMNMAADNPQDLGESVVISTDLVWVLEDGREVDYEKTSDDIQYEDGRPVTAITPYPLLRPGSFHNVDFVMEGNLTPHGLYAQFASAMLADSVHSDLMNLFNSVDAVREQYNIPIEILPDKLIQVGNAYLHRLGLGEKLTMSHQELQALEASTTETAPAADLPPLDNTPPDFQTQLDALAQRVEQSAAVEHNTVSLSPEEYARLLGLETQLATLTQQLHQLFQLMAGLQGNYEALHENQQLLNQKLKVLNNEQVQVVPVPNSAQSIQMGQLIPYDVLDQQPIHHSQRAHDFAKPADGFSPVLPSTDNNPMGRLMSNVNRRTQAKQS